MDEGDGGGGGGGRNEATVCVTPLNISLWVDKQEGCTQHRVPLQGRKDMHGV